MSRKRKELPILEDVTITDVAAEGKAIARVENMVVFVPYGAPGDVVDIKLDRKRNSYAEGHITAIKKPSQYRVEPICEHFTVCGGCKWQHIPYDYQLQCKQKQVKDALERIGKVEFPEIQTIIGSKNILEYRNKMEYTFSNKRWLSWEQMKSGEVFADRSGAGFHIPGAFDKVLDINKCHLQEDTGNRIRSFIKEYGRSNGLSFYDLRGQTGVLRTLMIRIASTGEIMVLMSFGENNREAIDSLMGALADNFPEITSLQYVVNTKANDTIGDLEVVTYKGKPYIEEEMEGLKFRIGPKSFYQTNSLQAYELYKAARKAAGLTGNELVYDLYTGTGTIACFVSRECKHVIGIEYVPEAIADAKVNAEINGLDNTEFYAGDMKDVLTEEFIAEHGRPDVMIIDPPRAGMHEDVVKVIMAAAPRRIVYVSCNPSTQARDVALMDKMYQIDLVQPVDMFPHTHHVENIIGMTLRK